MKLQKMYMPDGTPLVAFHMADLEQALGIVIPEPLTTYLSQIEEDNGMIVVDRARFVEMCLSLSLQAERTREAAS